MSMDNASAVLPRTAHEMRSRPDDGKPSYRPLTVTEVRAERRDDEPDGPIVITGLAAVFDSPSVDMYGWYEVIKRGAFRKVLATKPDVRLLFNHDGLPLARTINGTLTLSEVGAGLEFRAVLPDTQLARDIVVLIERGDLDQMSFAFRVGRDSWIELHDGRERREIEEFSALREISIVTFPAYEDTVAQVERYAPDDDTTFRSADDPEQPPVEGMGAEDDEPEERSDDPAGAPDDGAATRWRARQRLNALVINDNTTTTEGTHA